MTLIYHLSYNKNKYLVTITYRKNIWLTLGTRNYPFIIMLLS
ncbi:MAG: hypothetical protein HPY66_1727 [Firmicutes bacterium]|nr:hypothetical protein [Bacillota bacterium]